MTPKKRLSALDIQIAHLAQQGLTVVAIAAQTGRPVPTVWSGMSRARRAGVLNDGRLRCWCGSVHKLKNGVCPRQWEFDDCDRGTTTSGPRCARCDLLEPHVCVLPAHHQATRRREAV